MTKPWYAPSTFRGQLHCLQPNERRKYGKASQPKKEVIPGAYLLLLLRGNVVPIGGTWVPSRNVSPRLAASEATQTTRCAKRESSRQRNRTSLSTSVVRDAGLPSELPLRCPWISHYGSHALHFWRTHDRRWREESTVHFWRRQNRRWREEPHSTVTRPDMLASCFTPRSFRTPLTLV